MTISDERRAIAAELAAALGATTEEVDRAIQSQHERHLPQKRNLVSILASTAWLVGMLRAMADADREAWLDASDGDRESHREIALAGKIADIAAKLSDHLAGPYDVAWDGNWPSAAPRLRRQIPAGAQPGDVIVRGDGGGTRTQLRVIEDADGTLTAEVVADSWRDPPLEDVWLETYRRLADLYPEEVPPVG